MKKILCLSLLLLFVVTLAGCESDSSSFSEETPVMELKDWGITFTATDVTPTRLTIVCEQVDGEQQGELRTGSPYWLEVYESDTWQAVPYILDESSISWHMDLWIITPNGTTEWNVDWEVLYGELPVGTYRIGKTVEDYIDRLNCEEQTYYATFTITSTFG